VFASRCQPIPATSEQTDKYGTIELAKHAPSHTKELGENVVAALLPRAEDLETHGIACLLPRHGIVCVARDLDTAYDTLERIDRGARMHLLGRLLDR
jgi:ribulose-5-phosphate 4-epimerase/fuculose-1-phosphate aldolase